MYMGNRGFTLIEVLLVVMILSSLTAVAVPKLSNHYQNLRLETTVQQLLSDIRYVQQQSIITGCKHGIVFSLSKNCYYLIKNKNSPQILKKVELAQTKIKAVNLPKYYKIHFSAPSLFYKSKGNLDHRNGRIKLELNHQCQEIVFSSNAGEINIQ